MMKSMSLVFVALVAFCAVASAEEDACYQDAIRGCKHNDVNSDGRDEEHLQKKLQDVLINCNAIYSDFMVHEKGLQNYTNQQLAKSYEYMLLATNFGTYVKNRPGFEKQFRALSDKAWNNAIELIKYITKRGGEHNFMEKQPVAMHVIELNELQALSIALENEKSLTMEAHRLHKAYSHPHQPHNSKASAHGYDPEVAHFLDEKFIEGQADTIRTLSGYTNDLKHLIKLDASQESSTALNVHLFDEYLLTQ